MPDGVYHPVWRPAGSDPSPTPPGVKAEARRFTRVRRFRYYPVRVRGRPHRGRGVPPSPDLTGAAGLLADPERATA